MAAAVKQLIGNARTALAEIAGDGAFKRTASTYRNFIGVDPRFPAESGRYRLYVSYACPWACRTLAVFYMKGLQSAIKLSIVHPTWQRTRPGHETDLHAGWVFRKPTDPPVVPETGFGEISCEDCIPDEANGCDTIRALYELGGDTGGKYSVPVLWDEKLKLIVNNESSEIMRMFNYDFNAFAANPMLDLYPEALSKEVDAINDWVYPGINDGVYKCGFAKKQEAYETASQALYQSLARVEDILSKQRFLCGKQLTEADIRLFVTLIRFDEVYVVYFKCNQKCVREYPNILNYVRDIYQTPGVAASVNMRHIKAHYFTSHPALNAYSIVPLGPHVDFTVPHHRETM